ncbi:uncharacterized protein DAT39_010544, partial [Clarias magur]
CSKFLVDPDLDDCPLRPLVPPSPQTPPSQADLPKPEPSPPEQTDKQCPPPPPQYASMYPSLDDENSPQMPMVEVAGPDGAAVLVHRPWTTKDIEDAHRQLPDPREVGGDKFSKELVRFCREFRPTSHELRRLLMQKVSVDISRIRYQWPDANVIMLDPDWANSSNARYRTFVTELRDACQAAFPVRMDMTKISMCKQYD